MITNSKVRILWITDIHFSTLYTQDELQKDRHKLLNKYIDQFHLTVEELNRKVPIDYIFITGDLAQWGIKEDYARFHEVLISPLLHKLKGKHVNVPKIITIPGNHDVMWNNSKFLNDYIQLIDIETQKYPDRSDFLKRNLKDFRLLFEDYTKYIQKEAIGEYSEFFDLVEHPGFKASIEYRKSRLFGHVIDSKNKLIIVLINTAWFSLGEQFNDLFVKYIRDFKKLEDPSDDEILKSWFQIKDVLTEYSTQITGIRELEQAELKKYFKEYPDYFVVTCMHHSRNWLEWAESFAYSGKAQKSSTGKLLRELIRNSDLVLTGHEHVPTDATGERLQDDVLHFKGGCFLEFNQVNRHDKKENLVNNWFSFLEIDTAVKLVEQTRFSFEIPIKRDTDLDLINANWKAAKDEFPYVVAKYANYELVDERQRNTIAAYQNGTTGILRHFLTKIFRLQLLSDDDLILLSEPDNGHYKLYILQRPNRKEFILIPQKPNLFEKEFKEPSFFAELTHWLMKYPDISYLRFLTLDLFVDGNMKKKYNMKNCDRDTVFDHIVRVADNLFDVVRHHFFMQWEPDKDGNIAANVPFENVVAIKLINQVFPFWIGERFWMPEITPPANIPV